MRCLKKNKREFWYALYLGNEDGKDENGKPAWMSQEDWEEMNAVFG